VIPIHDDNPTDITPVCTVGIVLLCIWAYAWQLILGEHGSTRAIYAFGLIPGVLTGYAALPEPLDLIAPPWTLITSVFLHGSFLHLAGNMLYLWVFGNNIEDALGHGRFVAFFLFCGACAALVQTANSPHSVVPMVGASGAISGILGGFLLLHPRTSVRVTLPLGFIVYPLRVPAGLLLGLWFVVQIVTSLFADPAVPGVAWHAHIGGFVVGAVLMPFLKRPGVPLLQ
jgi:membrane associated rhomboid family serine protease